MMLSAQAQAFENGNLAYGITSPTTVEVTGPAEENSATDINIPDTVTSAGTTYSVTTIGSAAFLFKSLTSVTIGNSVTTIGSLAFGYNGEDFTKASFLGDFGTFDLDMFEGNPELKTITYDPLKTGWPQTFNHAGGVAATSGAFEQGDFAYLVTSATTVAVTGRASGNTDTVIVIPDTVTSSGIIYSVTSIGDQAFYFNSLASLTIAASVTTIGENAFGFNALNSVTIPNSVTTIGDDAFISNSLTSVTIGNSVATIGSRAFGYNDLTNVIFLGDFGTFDLNMFEGNSNLTRITYVQGKTGWEDKTFTPEPCCTITPTPNVFDNGNLAYRITSSTTVEVMGRASGNTDTEIVIPDTVTNFTVIYSVTSIGPRAFALNSLISVTIPNSVKTIGDEAFKSNMLTSLTLGDNVTTIGNYAFAQNELNSLTIGNNVTTIGDSAFYANDLISLTIPDSVTTIGVSAFNGNDLTIVSFLGDFGTFDLGMFMGNLKLTTITYVDGKAGWPVDFELNLGPVTSTNTFERGDFTYLITGANTVAVTGRVNGNTNTEIEILNTVTSNGIIYSVTSIGPRAFTLNSLISVTIPNSVTTIGNEAFKSNELTSVAIPDSVTTIGDNAFRDNKLTSVTLGDNVTTIRNGAFRNNQLTSLTIPNSVTTIGSNAFTDNKLTDVTFMGNFGTFDLNMFTGNANLTTITYDEDKSGWPVTFTPAGTGSVAAVPEPLPGLPIWLLYQATQ